jgi:hypothetical protein
MTQALAKRLFGVFTGALIGYAFGWILGWSAFDPNSDVWALAAAVGAILGLLIGVAPGFWQRAGMFIGAAIGLYLGWILRTLLFGDVPGGAGLFLIIGGALVGGLVGARPAFQEGVSLRALICAAYVGFFGGFLIDVILLDVILGWVKTHSILGQAPAVIACGVIGGLLGGWRGRRERRANSTA